MDKYIQKASILTKYFGLYGVGNFDLSIEEIANILKILQTKTNPQYLDVNLKEIYERLSKTRLG